MSPTQDSAPGKSGPGSPQEAQIRALQEFFNQLNKAMKNMRMYLHQAERFPALLKPAFDIFDEQLKAFGGLTLKVEQTGFQFKDTMVFEDEVSDQNIAFKFFQEGIRLLKFRQGLPLQEMLDFVVICLGASSRVMTEDILGQLWNKNLRHIEYVVMESYAVGGPTSGEKDQDLEMEVDQIVDHIYGSLSGKGTDQIQFARVSIEDLEIELEKIQQARGIRLGESSISPQLVSRFQDEVSADMDERMLPKLIRILLGTFSRSVEPNLVQPLGDSLILMLDFFLLREDFDHINLITTNLDKWQREAPDGAQLGGWREVFFRFRDKMSDGERIHRVAEIMDTCANQENIPKAYSYLKYLDRSSFNPLFQALETLNRPEARRVFCDVLAELGSDRLDVLEKKLASPKANLIRDILYIIDKIDPPNKLMMVARLLKHKNLAIRLEALKVIGSTENTQVLPYLKNALEDDEIQVRLTAANLLATTFPSVSMPLLLDLIKKPEFRDAPPQEQVGLYAALATTNALEALHYMRGLLQASGVFSKKKILEHKRCVIAGLANSGSINAYKILVTELKRGFKDPTVASLAQRACEALKQRLLIK